MKFGVLYIIAQNKYINAWIGVVLQNLMDRKLFALLSHMSAAVNIILKLSFNTVICADNIYTYFTFIILYTHAKL